MKKKIQPEEERMEQQTPEPVQEHTVKLSDGRTGTVTVQGDSIEVKSQNSTERWPFPGLLNAARRDALPTWVKQVPPLVQRIEEIFQRERERDENPHVAYALANGELFRCDLRGGTRIGAKVADLKDQLERTGTLPRAFNDANARELIARAA
ncbi:MAG: hypothetical protein ACRERD_33180 [Candidatus Binatia bacterium]